MEKAISSAIVTLLTIVLVLKAYPYLSKVKLEVDDSLEFAKDIYEVYVTKGRSIKTYYFEVIRIENGSVVLARPVWFNGTFSNVISFSKLRTPENYLLKGFVKLVIFYEDGYVWVKIHESKESD
ncbi:MAG: hypothetical protein DRJ52_06220 [Thermoprotei archaeon]|nr:MAG: hypothetical protein DRJ52_06220 [Thermoprotei archaeon]